MTESKSETVIDMIETIEKKNQETEEHKTVASEFARLNRIIKHLIDEGRFILNERPDDMTKEDFRFIRNELNKKRASYLKKGTLIHSSSSIFFDPKTRKNKQAGKGNTFVKEASFNKKAVKLDDCKTEE